MKTLTLIMVLALSGGRIAEQPASLLECEMVADALSKGETVQIDADDGHTYTVLASQCHLSDAYEGPCEMEEQS